MEGVGIKSGEIRVIISNSSVEWQIVTDGPTYDFIIPKDVYFKNPQLTQCIDKWCREHVGQKYATWDRTRNKFAFFKEQHKIACVLTWRDWD